MIYANVLTEESSSILYSLTVNYLSDMNTLCKTTLLFTMLFNSYQTCADWSVTTTAVSDYLFNGVSLTDEKPALQASITKSTRSGGYFGTWVSNIDFVDGSNFEADFYAGYAYTNKNALTIDAGISHYTFHGVEPSSQADFSEGFVKFNYQNLNFNIWYAPDYFGTDAGHYVLMLDHSFQINNDISLMMSIDKSISMDTNKWQWQEADKDYIHAHITAYYSLQNIDFSLGLHGTDLDDYGDTKLLFTISRSFDF